ncbi:MAG TPA: hypothetical protein VJP85_03840 [Candidatus Baltobacteraceae bacterium]|nr:hypothetical protein [Candidatus Baltobacteraceae bacterium]
MSAEFSRLRRFAAALLALAIAGVTFRPQLAQALVVRGDDYLYRGDTNAALERYRRALALSPSLEAAADRYVFVSMQQHTARALHDGIAEASRYLLHRPGDATLLSDRALCYLREKRYERAQRDFERSAGTLGAQAYVFAGWAAHHAGRFAAAQRLWRRALSAQPHYRPAVIALVEHPR